MTSRRKIIMDYDKLIQMRIDKNKFDRYVNIQVTEIREGYAKGEIDIAEKHMNIIQSVHGGCIFSLADTVAGSAAVSHGEYMTTVSANINYLSPAMGVEKLIAEATEVKYGRNISVYDVSISDEKGKLIARGSFSYYNLKVSIESQ